MSPLLNLWWSAAAYFVAEVISWPIRYVLAVAKMLKRFPEFFVLKRSDPCLSLAEKLKISVSRWSVVLLMLYSLVFSIIQLFDLDQILSNASTVMYGG